MENQIISLEETVRETQIITSARDLMDRAHFRGSMPIITSREMEEAADLVKLVKSIYNKAEEERTSITKPINAGLKAVNDRWKKILIPLKEAETKIKMVMADYQRNEEKRLRDLQEKQRKEAEAAEATRKAAQKKLQEVSGDLGIDSEIIMPPPASVVPIAAAKTTIRGETSVVSMKKVWRFKVVDIKLLAANCPEMVLPNQVEINKAIGDGIRDIPGLEIFEESLVSVR